MRKVFAVLVLFSCSIAWAQAPLGPRSASPAVDPVLDRRIQQEAFERWALSGDGAEKAALAAKQSQAAQEFYVKAKEFVRLWSAFADELNDKKTFNAKLAKQVAKAFHNLEKSDGWPVGHQK